MFRGVVGDLKSVEGCACVGFDNDRKAGPKPLERLRVQSRFATGRPIRRDVGVRAGSTEIHDDSVFSHNFKSNNQPSVSDPLHLRLPKRNNRKKDSRGTVNDAERKKLLENASNLTEAYINSADCSELLRLFRGLTAEARFDAALQVVREVARAKRDDVLRRLVHKDFLRPAAKHKAVKPALRFVQILPRKYSDARTYNMLITVCVRARDIANAKRVMDMLKSAGVKPDVQIYTNLITACATLGNVEQAFKYYAEMKGMGLKGDQMLFGALVNSCAVALRAKDLGRRKQLVILERAFHLLEDLHAHNTVADSTLWNTLISCAARTGQLQRTFEVLQRMQSGGCQPDAYTYSSLVDACSKMEERGLGLKIYRRALREEISHSIVLHTSAVRACFCSGEVDLETALDIHSEVEKLGVVPDSQFYVSLITAAGKAGQLSIALSMYSTMVENDITVDNYVCSALISAALDCKELERAQEIYDSLVKQGVYPLLAQYNSMIVMYGALGRLGDVVRLVEDLMEARLQPGVETFTAIVAACERSGQSELAFGVASVMKTKGILVDEGLCFSVMRACYNRLAEEWYKGQDVACVKSFRCHSWSPSPTGEPLLKALAGEGAMIPALVPVGSAEWVDRAVTVYRSLLSTKAVPSLRLLNRLFACLRIPKGSTKTQEDLSLYTPFTIDLHLAEVHMGKLESETTEQVAETEAFDSRATQLAKEAVTLNALPQFSLDRDYAIDMLNMPPVVAEVYVLLMFTALGKRNNPRRKFGHAISFKVPPFNPKEVMLPNSKLKKTENVDEEEEIEEEFEEDDYEPNGSLYMEEYPSDSSLEEEEREPYEERDITATASTSLGVAAMLRRLKLWCITEPSKGLIYVEAEEIDRWLTTRHKESLLPLSQSHIMNEMSERGMLNPLMAQQRNIRLGNLEE